MREQDYLRLDGKALHYFLVVYEEGSVSRAAERLGTSQSAVSHILDKLRDIVGDPLFVRAGRGIAPTSGALALAEKARASLDSLRDLTVMGEFDPEQTKQHFSIATNDYQRDYLLPNFFQNVRSDAPGMTFGVIPTYYSDLAMLREDRCQLMIVPQPPSATDIVQRRLLTDRYICYYDAECREAPATVEDYLSAQHVVIMLSGYNRLPVDKMIDDMGLKRDVFLSLPNFAGALEFIRGTDLIATLPSLMSETSNLGVANCPPPFDLPDFDIFMLWHERYHSSPSHRWMRNMLVKSCNAEGI